MPGPPWMRKTGVPVPMPETLYQMRPPVTANIPSPGPRTGVAVAVAALGAAAVVSAGEDFSPEHAARTRTADERAIEDGRMG